jgi:hypothetical protein
LTCIGFKVDAIRIIKKMLKIMLENNDLACSLEDDQLPYLKNIQKEGCKCVLLEGEGHAPFKVGLKWK